VLYQAAIFLRAGHAGLMCLNHKRNSGKRDRSNNDHQDSKHDERIGNRLMMPASTPVCGSMRPAPGCSPSKVYAPSSLQTGACKGACVRLVRGPCTCTPLNTSQRREHSPDHIMPIGMRRSSATTFWLSSNDS